MVECNSEGFQAYSRKFTEVHLVLAKNAGVHTLIEVHSPLHWHTTTVELGSRNKSEVSNFCNDLLESTGRNNVVVHQRQVLLRAVEFIDTPDNRTDRFCISLISF